MESPRVVIGKRGDIEYSLFKESDWEGVQKILLSSFCLNEPICIATGINLPENEGARQEVAAVSLELLRNGLSLVARDVTNGMIVGHAINLLKVHDHNGQPRYFADFENLIGGHPCTKAYVNFAVPVDLLALHNVKCVFEIGLLGTSADYKKAGIGRALCEFSIQLARRMKDGEFFEYVSDEIREAGLRPQVISGTFSSAFSRRIAEQLGLEANGKVEFADVMYDGKSWAERINDDRHTMAVLMSMRL